MWNVGKIGRDLRANVERHRWYILAVITNNIYFKINVYFLIMEFSTVLFQTFMQFFLILPQRHAQWFLRRGRGGRERGRETLMLEKLINCLLHWSRPETEPATQARDLESNLRPFGLWGWGSNQLNHTTRPMQTNFNFHLNWASILNFCEAFT